MNVPTSPGPHWAKWRVVDDGTDDDGECCSGANAEWEVVIVYVSELDRAHPQYLMVHVPGVAKSQSIENFFWAPGGPLQPPRMSVPPRSGPHYAAPRRTASGAIS